MFHYCNLIDFAKYNAPIIIKNRKIESYDQGQHINIRQTKDIKKPNLNVMLYLINVKHKFLPHLFINVYLCY